MKLLPLCSALLLASCNNLPNPSPLVEAYYTANMSPALHYQPGVTEPIPSPLNSSAGPAGAQWVVHYYTVSNTPQGERLTQYDTLVVGPDGRVLFY